MRFARDNGALDLNIAEVISQHKFYTKYETCLKLFDGLNQGNPEIGFGKI